MSILDCGPFIPRAPALVKKEKIGDVRHLPWTKRSSKEEIECHKEIAAYIRQHVLKLEAVARREYYANESGLSPYTSAPE